MRTWLAVAAVAHPRRCSGAAPRRRVRRARSQAHLAMLDRGAHPPRPAARRGAARRRVLRFGGPMQIKEQQPRPPRPAVRRDHAAGPPLRTARAAQEPGVLARSRSPRWPIGIGAGTAVFSVVGAVLLRPLPYADPRRAGARSSRPTRSGTGRATSRRRPTTPTGRAQNTSLHRHRRLRAVQHQRQRRERRVPHRLRRAAGAEVARRHRQPVSACSARAPLLGPHVHRRGNVRGQGARRGPELRPVAERRSAAIPAIVGKTDHAERPRLRRRRRDAARRSSFPGRDVQLWVPVGYTPSGVRASRAGRTGSASSRGCKPGVSLEQAQQEMDGIARQLEQQYPDTNTQMGVRLERSTTASPSEPRPALLMLSGAVGLLFLIVCANIANLQLGRAVSADARAGDPPRARRRARARLLRQLLTESLVLSVVGGALGLRRSRCSARTALTAIRRVGDAAVRRGPARSHVCCSSPSRCRSCAPVIFGVAAGAHRRRSRDRVTERSEVGVARHAVAAQRAGRRRGRAVDRARRRRRAAGAQPACGCRRSIPGFDQEHAVTFTLTLPSARYPDAADRAARVRGDRAAAAGAAGRPGGRRRSARWRCAASPGPATRRSKGAPPPTTSANCATSR